MAVLPTATIDEVNKEYQSDISAEHDIHDGVAKSDIRDAIVAVDQWVEDNKISFNNALPNPVKSSATPLQKSRMLTYVVRRRWQVGE